MVPVRIGRKALVLILLSLVSVAHAQPIPLDTARIDAHVAEIMRSARIPGVAIGIVHEGGVVYLKGYGDKGDGKPVTPQTLFYVASVSKPFTALAVMQLVEAKQVALDLPVQKYVPQFQLADPDASSQMTVRHLLCHVSGLSTLSGRQHFFRRDNGPNVLADYVQQMRKVRPTARVGAQFQYSNTNYTTLARLVEVVSGVPFEQYVSEHILTPLEMRRTCLSATEADGRATGHRYWFGWPVAISDVPRRVWHSDDRFGAPYIREAIGTLVAAGLKEHGFG